MSKVERACPECGTRFWRYPSQSGTYCSRACNARAGLRRRPARPPSGRVTEPPESEWRRVARQSRPWVCEECASTARLDVHHRDRNRSNNAPENLQVLCTACHHAKHRSQRTRIEVRCVGCGAAIAAFPHDADRRRYCSRPCMWADPAWRAQLSGRRRLRLAATPADEMRARMTRVSHARFAHSAAPDKNTAAPTHKGS